jgi:PTH1 family peptidyl-tRNA hydrolase
VKLIVGLGNPGREYAATRHNVGWWAVDTIATEWDFGAWKRDGSSLIATGRRAGQSVRLLKPQTYMNLSGSALVQYCRRPTWNPADDLLVIVDEVALPVGRLRLRANGSAGGHNGLKSIEAQLGNRDYARLRIGIHPADDPRGFDDLADFVLGPFAKDEAATVTSLLARVRDGVEIWLRDGIEPAMNVLNRTPNPDPPPST